MKVIKIDGRRFLALSGAGSRRTEGFPVRVVRPDGELVTVARTSKRERLFALPEGELWAARWYISNSGKEYVFIYSLPEEGEATEVTTVTSVTQALSLDIPEGVRRHVVALLAPELEEGEGAE